MCAFFVYVSPQTFADVGAIGSSVPQLLEDLKGELGHGSPVSNTASANTATNSESVGHNTDLQVCLSFSVTFSLFVFLRNLSHILSCHSYSRMSFTFKIICYISIAICSIFTDMCVVKTTETPA